MYPNLNRFSFHEDNKNSTTVYETQYEFGGYPKLGMSLAELRQIVQSNIHTYDPKQYKVIDKFLQDEQVYVDKLAVLEVQKFDLCAIKIPYYDLQSIFGFIEEIKNIHGTIFPQHLIRIYCIEDILRVFVMHAEKLRIYIKDEWKKSQVKFEGKKAILKRFYNTGIIKDLSLPEQKISDYLKFHEQIKSNYEHIKSSEIFQQSFQLFNNIYIQMQYVKQAAVIEKFQMPLFQNIHLVNLFYVSVDGGLAVRYKVFLMDNDVIFTSLGSSTKPVSYNLLFPHGQRCNFHVIRIFNQTTKS
ncbi:hypothetical protein QE152_g14291 [Popillia japonica]|uniref:DH domain-containing protein n=1 Tax=Popillia japonica TaxID=7064 RepID=A0AAW1L743_POPJA